MTQRIHHLRWDVDKTYLRTDFDGVAALVRTFRQTASEKVTVPGATTLIRELLAPRLDAVDRRVMFISGSPRQMRDVLTEKLRLDGIEPDRFVLKPNLSNVLLLRFRSVRSQVGYKLSALLRSMLREGDVVEMLFGDDSEQDAFIYSLYADLLSGEVSLSELAEILDLTGIPAREKMDILERAAILPSVLDGRAHRVERIFIHLDRRSPTARFVPFGPRVVAVYNYAQAAMVMFWSGKLEAPRLLRVLGAVARDGYSGARLANSVQDLVRRGHGSADDVGRMIATLRRGPELLASTPPEVLDELARLLEAMPLYPPSDVGAQPVPPYRELAGEHKYVPPRFRLPRLSFLDTDR